MTYIEMSDEELEAWFGFLGDLANEIEEEAWTISDEMDRRMVSKGG